MESPFVLEYTHGASSKLIPHTTLISSDSAALFLGKLLFFAHTLNNHY